ncbi:MULTISPECIES: tryptophan 2,3-dioxygenase [unclassified Meiothermus]|uniref:tryptophan 2,3-dioxygenase n=1 Tax=unclassified Meiothermus TaxID=370471 RepID=UPI000D7C8771|nr:MULTISPECIES: tryptophan 2,3-dioxygenase [unclassified Meiothermus]PZA05847.1 tryptophan 2,3-dioxygenase [Meiothermus sp. Pnk-1]RYM40866.1 tryptophan 2,3-dioxygenase [Meiothermus sp. PNK-Is4]
MNKPNPAEGAYTDFKNSLSYGDYLALDELLSAQRPLTPAHDEVLFIVIHQVSELWMKLIIHELEGAMQLLKQGVIDPSLKMLTRVCRAQEQMTSAWEVLKTMTPSDYLEFRSAFGQASGFQSYQYRLIEFLLGNRNPFMMRPHEHRPDHHALLQDALSSPSLYDLSLRLLAQRGFTIPAEVLERDFAKPYEPNPAVLQAWLEVYRNTLEHWDLYYLAEKLIDVEDNFRRWRFNHLTTVERMIGHKRGSGGTAGVGYLKKVLEVVLFPELWQVRTEL